MLFPTLLIGIFSLLFSTVKSNEIVSSSNYSYVDTVELPLYDGFWYEVYKDAVDDTFQKRGSCVTANYTIWNDGKLCIVNCEVLPNGDFSFIDGYAFYSDDNSGGELTVRLDNVDSDAPYWIIELGPVVDDQYDYAIVSDDIQLTLFVLARDVDRFYKLYDADVLNSLDYFGFNSFRNRPIKTNQSDSCKYI